MIDKSLPDVSRTVGREAQRNNILAARVVADLVKTTLGPKGMDKMLVDSTGNVIVTNDGVTILEELELDHPAAKIIVDSAKTQEKEVGDGTTSVALIAGSLLEHAEKLLERRIHPTAIIRGYNNALNQAKEIIKQLGIDVTNKDALLKIAMTAMTGKGVENDRVHLSELVVRAIDLVSNNREVDESSIKIASVKSDNMAKSELIDGLALDHERAHADMPRKVENSRIALIDFPLEIHGPETEAKLEITSPDQLRQFLESEEHVLREMTLRIVDSGAKVLFCQKGIDDVAQYYLAKAGIMAFRRVPRNDMEKLAKATGGRIISNIKDIMPESFGFAGSIEEVKQGDEVMTYIRGCKNPKAVSIVIHGSTRHGIDEIERALADGIGVVASSVREGHYVPGGGAIELALAHRLKIYARTLSGKEQLAAEAFADALEVIPETLAENAGLDPIEILTELRKRHASGQSRDGLNLLTDKIEDCVAAGVIEPLKVKLQALNAANEVATLLLRIDDVLISGKKPELKENTID